jgi:succinate-acetate transporter protein
MDPSEVNFVCFLFVLCCLVELKTEEMERIQSFHNTYGGVVSLLVGLVMMSCAGGGNGVLSFFFFVLFWFIC